MTCPPHPTRRFITWVLSALSALSAVSSTRAQTSYPMVTHAVPVAVQRGQTVEVTVNGQMDFAGAYRVLFDGPGVTATVAGVAPPRAEPRRRGGMGPRRSAAVNLKVSVVPDAPLGVREFRVASDLGVSSVGQLLVVDDPVVRESGDNNSRDKAKAVPVPCVVCGLIEAAEDLDVYKFRAAAGQTFTFEVHGARLQDKIHDLQKHADPLLVLFDAAGRELAASDDASFADPLLTYTIPTAGDYFVQVRDSKYDGDPRWVYALTVTDRPRVSQLYPMAGNPGQVVEVEPVGSAKAVRARVPLRVPTEPGVREVQLDLGGTKTNPAAFVVSPLPLVLEAEPNDDPKQATPVPIPGGVNGRIGVRRDLDHFAFKGVKGKAVRFEVQARRFGSPLRSSLDSVLDVLDAKGSILANNDDLVGKDAGLVFTPPADGAYVLRIRDLNSKGGDGAVYFIEADHARPDFALKCDPDKAMIGPGSSTAWYVLLTRSNGFNRPVKVEVHGLPKGVTASPLTIPPAMTQGLIVLTAAADAPKGVANVQVVGTATAPEGRGEALVRQATPVQEIYNPGGGRARFDVNLQTVAVTGPSDILKVDVSPQAVTLKPGQEVRIDVTVQRRKDYDKAVSLDVMLRHLGGVHGNPLPPGVTVVEGKSKTLLGTGRKGHVTLRADATAAPVEGVPVSVLCHVSINFVVKVSYSSAPIPVSVKK